MFQNRKLFDILLKALLSSLTGIFLYYAASFIHKYFLVSSTTLVSSVALYNDDFARPMSRETSCILDRRYFTDKASILNSTNSDCIAEGYKRRAKDTMGKIHCYNSAKCQLLPYKMEDIVKCLDSMQDKRNHKIHITFIGDSLVRNQFTSFIGVRKTDFLFKHFQKVNIRKTLSQEVLVLVPNECRGDRS